MAINIKVGDIAILDSGSKVPDKEIIGVIVPSETGYDYPRVITSFKEFERIFNDGKVELTKYRYLYDMGYYLAPVRLGASNKKASVTLTVDPKFHKYWTDASDLNFTFQNDGFVDDPIDESTNFTNHMIIEVPEGRTVDRGISGKERYGPDCYLTLPGKLTGETKWSKKLSVSSTNGYALNNLGLDINNYELDASNYPLAMMMSNGNLTGLRTMGGPNFTHPLNDLKIGTRKWIFYSATYFPLLIPNRNSLVKVSTSQVIEHSIYKAKGKTQSFMTIRSIMEGDYGRKISIKFDHTPDFSSLVVMHDLVEVERFKESDIFNLVVSINTESNYIRIFDLKENILGTRSLSTHTDLYQLDQLEDDLTKYIDSLSLLYEEDVDIDIILYDLQIDPHVLNLINEKSQDNILTVVNLPEDRSDLDQYPHGFYVLGDCLLSGMKIPSSYIYLMKFKSTYVGDVSLGSQLRTLFYPVNNPLIHEIQTDGLKYYISHFPDLKIVTRHRIHRRMRRVTQDLGQTLNDLGKHIENLISELRSDLNILESIELKELSQVGNNATVVIEYKFPQLRPEVFTINMKLNILQ